MMMTYLLTSDFLAEINCGSPGILPNGWLEGTRTTLHAVVTFRCQEGMTFEGPSYRTICQADGKCQLYVMLAAISCLFTFYLYSFDFTGRWSHPLPRCYGRIDIFTLFFKVRSE